MLNRKEPLESHLKNTNTICSTARPSNHGERQGRTRGVARGGGCWRCAQAAATRGDVSREWRFPRDPPFFPCAVCVVVTRMPGQVFQCKKQNAKRSCSIALSSSFRMPTAHGDRTKEDLSFCGCTFSALAWKDPLEASPFLSSVHCSEMRRKTKSSLCRDSSQFTYGSG